MEKKAKENIKAVHDYEFVSFLKKLDVYDDVINERKKCKFCKNIVNIENIATVFAESGAIQFVCDKPYCIAKLGDYLTDRK